MCEIDVLDKPDEDEEIFLRNRIISKHRKKKFLAKFNKNDYLIYLRLYTTDEKQKLFTIIDNPNEFVEKVNNNQNFLKIETIKTKLQIMNYFNNINFLSDPHWENGLSNYKEGEPTKYSIFETYISKSSLKEFFIGKQIKELMGKERQ